MQTKIHQAMNGRACDSNRGSQTCGAAETIRRAQVLARPFEHYYCKPNTEREPDQAAAREQLKIIVVSLLRRHSPRRIVESRNGCPVAAHSYSQDRMGDKHAPRCFPNLISPYALA